VCHEHFSRADLLRRRSQPPVLVYPGRDSADFEVVDVRVTRRHPQNAEQDPRLLSGVAASHDTHRTDPLPGEPPKRGAHLGPFTGGLFGFGVLYDFWTLNEQIDLANASGGRAY